MQVNIDTIFNDVTENITGSPLMQLIELYGKHKGYITALYWIKHNKHTGEARQVYTAYEIWCLDNDYLPKLPRNSFTRLLQTKKVFVVESLKNKKRVTVYKKLDHCPTCKRDF